MPRTADALDGLSILGTAKVGPLAFSVPTLLQAGTTGGTKGDGPQGPTLAETASTRSDFRSLRIGDGVSTVSLEFPIPAAEVQSVAGGGSKLADGWWLLHWPVSEVGWEEILQGRPEGIVLSNARTLFSEGEPLIRALLEIRTRLGAGPLLWAPRVALPHRLALLAFLGLDLLDSTEALWRSASGEFLSAELGAIDAELVRTERLCECPACTAGEELASGRHAQWALGKELRLVRTAIRAGHLRDVVESRLPAEPSSAEFLRYADRMLGDLLDERTPVTGGSQHRYVLRESHRRPEVRRYRARLLDRYRPPPSKKVLLLVPCSKTKPYRQSRSHRKIARALEGIPNLSRLEIASVTSPLGIVPRELEDVPPCRHYDIPVTGEWDEEERAAVERAVAHLLASHAFQSVLVHLDPQEYAFLRSSLKPAVATEWTMADEQTTGANNLRGLRAAAARALERLEGTVGGVLGVVREELESVARFQFGTEAAELLFAAPIRLQGRPWFQRLTDGHGKDLATLREERGLFHLTMAGATRVHPAHPLEVEILPQVPLLGDIFVPGVARADRSIRAGDAVLVVRNGELLATGEAALPGPLMRELARGVAVRIRHRLPSLAREANRQTQDAAPLPPPGPVV
ncbi:MAG: DUF5591 domain-containing protein [Thermoplasmata archaeon]|nr:DUF5591 domain-containing protein [Thermoplasmata archaeon]